MQNQKIIAFNLCILWGAYPLGNVFEVTCLESTFKTPLDEFWL